jgi:DNA-binding response OmpR family regulator
MISLSSLLSQAKQVTENPLMAMSRILIIDDDCETTELLKIILEPNAFEVVVAHSGEEGVRLAHTAIPDVIVVDMFMPEMDGLTTCRAIRQFSNTPVIIISAYDKPGTMEQVFSSGADDYLIKPLNSTLLVALIHRLARRARAEQNGARCTGSGYAADQR